MTTQDDAGETDTQSLRRDEVTADQPRADSTGGQARARTGAVAREGRPAGAVTSTPAAAKGERGAAEPVGDEAARRNGAQAPPASTSTGTGASGTGATGRGTTATVARPAPVRPARAPGRGAARLPESKPAKPRRIRLTLKRIDPWSVFVFSLAVTFFLGIAFVVAVLALFSVLDGAGVIGSVNSLVREVTNQTDPVLTSQRALTAAVVLGALEVVLLTLLATLGALLYNVCASFTGGLELTLGERDHS